jgi:hypothetical protein
MTTNEASADFLGIEKEDFTNIGLYDIWGKKEAERQIKSNQEVISKKSKLILKNGSKIKKEDQDPYPSLKYRYLMIKTK